MNLIRINFFSNIISISLWLDINFPIFMIQFDEIHSMINSTSINKRVYTLLPSKQQKSRKERENKRKKERKRERKIPIHVHTVIFNKYTDIVPGIKDKFFFKFSFFLNFVSFFFVCFFLCNWFECEKPRLSHVSLSISLQLRRHVPLFHRYSLYIDFMLFSRPRILPPSNWDQLATLMAVNSKWDY